MRKIRFKFVPEDTKNFTHAAGWIVLGDHFVDRDGDKLLSPECVRLVDVEHYVKMRKAELDAALEKARKKFKE